MNYRSDLEELEATWRLDVDPPTADEVERFADQFARFRPSVVKDDPDLLAAVERLAARVDAMSWALDEGKPRFRP